MDIYCKQVCHSFAFPDGVTRVSYVGNAFNINSFIKHMLLNMFSLLNAMRLAIQQTFILSCNLQHNWSENHGAKEMFFNVQTIFIKHLECFKFYDRHWEAIVSKTWKMISVLAFWSLILSLII